MAATRLRIDKQNIKSTTPRSLVYTDLTNEQAYFAPPSGADYVLQWDDASTDFTWLPTTSLINIYNNDGTLTGNRTLSGDTNTLNFNFSDGGSYSSDYLANSALQYLNVIDVTSDTSASVEVSPYSVILSTVDNTLARQAQISLSGDLELYRTGPTGTNSIQFSNTGMLVTDSNTSQGLKYAASYAAYFATNPRSIPDVGYVNSLISGMVTGSGTATRVAFWSSSGALSSSANLYWDNTNNGLGIGTSSFGASRLVLKNTQEPTRTLAWTENFSTDPTTTGWTLGTGWTWNGTQAVATAASGSLSKSVTVAIGNTYEIVFTAVRTAGTATITIGGASFVVSTSQTNTVSFIATSTASLSIITSTFTGSFDNITVTQVSTPAPYLLAGQAASASTLYMPLVMANNTNIAFGGGGTFTTGTGNNFFGEQTGLYNTTGQSNNFIGYRAGRFNTTGQSNNFFGNQVGLVNTTGNNNNFFGNQAGIANTTGSNNNFFGQGSGLFNTTGSDNNFFGTSTGLSNTTGAYNNAFGIRAGAGLTTGTGNNFFGYETGISTNTANFSNFFGYQAGYNNISGSDNIAIGTQALYNLSTTGTNVAIGRAAGYTTTGSANVFLGYTAGYFETGSNKLYIANTNTTTPLIYGDFSTGRLGILVNAPTAKLHLPVGTATASTAPIKFTTTSAALLTTPEAGAMEVLTTRIYYTDSTATRNTLAYLTDITGSTSIITDYFPVGTGTGITASTVFRDSTTLLTSTDAVRSIGILLNGMTSLTSGFIANTGLTSSSTFYPLSAQRGGTGAMVLRLDNGGTGSNLVWIKGNTTGDSYVLFNTGTSNDWSLGTDASASHTFKLRYGSDPSTGTTLLTASSGGNVGIRTDPHATQQIYLSGTLRVDLGSDATGDVYYRNSGGAFTRLAAGTNGHVLTLASGIPSWAAVSTGITSGTTKQIPYYSASNTLSSPSAAGVDALTWDFATAFFGVGTNAPASRLHVVNSNATTSYATFSGLLNTSASITSLDISRTAGSGSLDLVQTHSGTGNNCIVLQGNGTGDTFFTYGVSGPSVAYSHGVDASDSLIWKFGSGGTGSNPSTNTNLFWTANHTTNKIGLRTNPHATQDIYLLGTLRLDLGSDATGDIYYRNSGGAFTRLGIGSTDQVLKVASGIPSWSADLNGIYTGSGSLSTDTTVSMGTHFLFIEGSSATSHATFINLTPATDTIDIVARDLSIGSYIGEVYIDPTFVSIGLEHDTIPGGDASYINFQPTGSTWIWGNHEITLDGSGITVTDAVGSGFVYAADYSTSILTNNRSVPDIFTVRENNIENYTIVTSTTSPFNLSGLPPDFLINQGGTQATFTFSLPATPANGQICKLTFNNIVTTLTITAQGGITILGTAPTTAMVGTQLEYKYYSSISAWIRVK